MLVLDSIWVLSRFFQLSYSSGYDFTNSIKFRAKMEKVSVCRFWHLSLNLSNLRWSEAPVWQCGPSWWSIIFYWIFLSRSHLFLFLRIGEWRYLDMISQGCEAPVCRISDGVKLQFGSADPAGGRLSSTGADTTTTAGRFPQCTLHYVHCTVWKFFRMHRQSADFHSAHTVWTMSRILKQTWTIS